MELHSKLLENITPQSTLYSTLGFVALYFIYAFISLWRETTPVPGFPVIGEQEKDFFAMKAKFKFAMGGRTTLIQAFKQFRDKIVQFNYHSGPALVVPIQYLDEIRNHPDLDMTAAATQDFFINYPAFAPIQAGIKNDTVAHMINKKLTPSLALITDPVNEENSIAIPKIWSATDEWKETLFMDSLGTLISQVSSRVFLGVDVCRNPEWIKIGKDYTIDLMIAAYCMRFTPSFIRPLAYFILPPVWKLSNTVKKARAIIQPEVDRRRKARAEALARGEKIPKHLDTIDWLDETTGSRNDFDYVGAQLSLTFAAIHTTSNTLLHLMYDIIEHSEIIPELRDEIIQAHTEDGGFKKTTLYKLKLMDSVMKESQRMNMLGLMMVTRFARKEITLNDGTVLPKGSRIFFNCLHMQDEAYYPNPQKWDGKRFLNLRNEPGASNKYQFVTTGVEHVGFGHGQHSCPGRFFASNEIKLIMAHFLMNYDWAFKDGVRPKNLRPEANELIADQSIPLLYKSRKSEIVF